MAPPIAFTIPFFLTYRYLGLIDTLVGLIIIYLTFNLSLVIWMMRTFFDGLPRSLEEAAGSTGPPCGGVPADRRCRWPDPASPRRRSSASCSPGTTSSSPWC